MAFTEGRDWTLKAKIYRCNCRNLWSIQNRKMKLTANSILLIGEWLTECKPKRNCNPKGFVTTTECRNIVVDPSAELLKNYIKITKLVYNKAEVSFNFNNGSHLFFNEEGACYLITKK